MGLGVGTQSLMKMNKPTPIMTLLTKNKNPKRSNFIK